MLIPRAVWAICSSLSPSGMVNGDCSNVTSVSERSLMAALTLETPCTTKCKVYWRASPYPQAAATPQVLGSEFPLAKRRPFFVGVRIFSKKHPSKNRLPVHFGREQTQAAFICLSV